MRGLVWYVAYGSNLAADRFAVYLRGGTPAGGRRACTGARDPAPPRDDRPVTLDHPLYFARASPTWGGGIALVDHGRRAGACTLGRAWLITTEQFEDVVAQERRAPHEAIDMNAVARDGALALGDGRYGTLVSCPAIAGLPAVTCTAPPPGPEGPAPARPALEYLRTIGRGLAETHGLGAQEAAGYLAHVPGARGAWDRGRLAAALAEAVNPAAPARRRRAGRAFRGGGPTPRRPPPST